MKELLEKIVDEARGMWRFRRYAVVAAWVVCIAGWTTVLFLPNKYEAAARVFVDPTTALKPVIENLAVQQDVNAELNLVRQTLLSESQLQKVIDTVGLGTNANTVQKKAKLITDLRNRIEVTVRGSGPPSEQQNMTLSKVYTITYQDSDRNRSLKVVSLLLNNFMEGILGGKREGSQKAQQFLEEQIKDYERRLSEAEQRLADFKKNNMGMVPGDHQGDYFTRLQNEIDAVKKSQTALASALTRRETLQRQLRGEAPIAASTGFASGAANQGMAGGGGVDTLSRIKETQARLDELLLRFTDKHPDVVAARRTLEDLKARRALDIDALRRGDPNAAALTGASSNPVYQNIQLSLNQVDVDISTIRSELADHQQKVAALKQFVDTTPQVEAEYARLNRNYSVTKAQYTALAERLEKARVGEEADASGSVRFEVIDPPTAPYAPVSPKRSMLLAGVLLAGLGAGLGVAFLFNMLKPVFYDIRSLATLGIPVLGAVSLLRTDLQLSAIRSGYVRYSVMTGMLVLALIFVVIIGRLFAPLG